MPGFYDAIDGLLDETAKSDRQLVCRPTVEAHFLSSTVRIWGGIGPMITPDGERWHGWNAINDGGDVVSFFQPPKLTDIRDGSSPLYEFTLGYVDEETYHKTRDLEEEVKGRLLVCSSVYLEEGKTRAATPPGDSWRLRMKQSRFSEKITKDEDGGHRRLYSMSVIAKNINEGRSMTQFGIMNDAGQRARSLEMFGVADDAYAQFVVAYINGKHLNISDS
ncbi:hypothetical protein [Pararhizobium mangrovi]|uniref:Uncharacterized protein n=1 Tax=Pararhizobium mangrovi TaxID=2590452 RepID=A0A506U9Q7_9HYPH|nr:hypothetical protein [Pararhizobium mangrovi]TPW31172.1 hypothetical protein FJU11_02950 [Pararhizobium mangrovi]